MQKAWKILYRNHQIDRIAEISDRYDNKSQREKIFKKKEKQREREREKIFLAVFPREILCHRAIQRERSSYSRKKRTRDDIICGISV